MACFIRACRVRAGVPVRLRSLRVCPIFRVHAVFSVQFYCILFFTSGSAWCASRLCVGGHLCLLRVFSGLRFPGLVLILGEDGRVLLLRVFRSSSFRGCVRFFRRLCVFRTIRRGVWGDLPVMWCRLRT